VAGGGPAALQVKVTTVDGPVELKIPAGTQPGTTLLMAKRGVPKLGANQIRGNHNVSQLAPAAPHCSFYLFPCRCCSLVAAASAARLHRGRDGLHVQL
jgi:hypothetical protein